MDARNLITPYMIACEFQMLLARELQVCPLEGEMKFAVIWPWVDDSMLTAVHVNSLGAVAEIRFTTHELTLSMDEFSERCVVPHIEHIKQIHRGKRGPNR